MVTEAFVFSREERARPTLELFAQIEPPHGRRTYVLAIRDLSRSGALIELSGFRPKWLEIGQEIQLTMAVEGVDECVDLRGPVARVVHDENDPVFAVRFEGQSRRARRFLDRYVASGRIVRAKAAI